MNNKRLIKIFSVIVGLASVFGVGLIWAYDLTLTKVGTMSTLGVDYSLVKYNGSIPTLEGTASPSALVAVKVNTGLNYATAAADGSWHYVPSTLSTGDNSVVITSSNQTISFILRFNSATESATVSATPSVIPDEATLPDTGVWENYLIGFLVGAGVFISGRYIKNKMQLWEGRKQ